MDWKDIDRVRVPGFAEARRGYDKREVDGFLGRLADWLETDAASEIGQAAVTRKLELVGKSTAAHPDDDLAGGPAAAPSRRRGVR
jgi:DivIVA domain-containing protein